MLQLVTKNVRIVIIMWRGTLGKLLKFHLISLMSITLTTVGIHTSLTLQIILGLSVSCSISYCKQSISTTLFWEPEYLEMDNELLSVVLKFIPESQLQTIKT